MRPPLDASNRLLAMKRLDHWIQPALELDYFVSGRRGSARNPPFVTTAGSSGNHLTDAVHVCITTRTASGSPPYAKGMANFLLLSFIGLLCASVSASSPVVLSRYRAVSLGDSVQTVVERLQITASDVKVLHDRPALVQELTWRTRPFVSGVTVAADPLAEMVLTFHRGHLARIVATYDRERTIGLTDADLEELLSEVYGVALLRSNTGQVASSAPSSLSSLTPRRTVSMWADDDTTVTLWREEYPARVGLLISAVAAVRDLQQAIADGARLAAAEAPQRDREKQAAAAAALKDRDAQIRLENKSKFKP